MGCHRGIGWEFGVHRGGVLVFQIGVSLCPGVLDPGLTLIGGEFVSVGSYVPSAGGLGWDMLV